MRCLAVLTAPLWEHPDGKREPGVYKWSGPYEPEVVGWVNCMIIDIGDESHLLLLAKPR